MRRNIRTFLKTYFLVSQIWGILGSILIGNLLDTGLSGYVFGYLIGVILSLGAGLF